MEDKFNTGGTKYIIDSVEMTEKEYAARQNTTSGEEKTLDPIEDKTQKEVTDDAVK